MRARITFDKEALASNVALMRGLCGDAALHAVIKAGAYGLGVGFGGLDGLTDRLLSLGCSAFVVAEWEQAVSVRARHPSVSCFALNGIVRHADAEGCLEHGILPVLNTLDSWHLWREVSKGSAAYALHVDTGMNRLGLREEEAIAVAEKMREEGGGMSSPLWLMSHLACADDQLSPKNAEQLHKFKKLCILFPNSRKSFANSAGCFLGREYHFDAVRVGAALYGLNPVTRSGSGDGDDAGKEGELRGVLSVDAPIVQVRDVGVGGSVGYGGLWVAGRASRIAIVAFGYGDGYPFCRGGGGLYQEGILCGERIRVVGRVSMDLLALDVTDVCCSFGVGDYVILLGGGVSVEGIAGGAGDLNYNVLGGVGSRGVGRSEVG